MLWQDTLAGDSGLLLAAGGIRRVLAVKSGATLSPNPLFMHNVLRSIQFLKVTATLTAYLQQLSEVTWLRGGGRSPPAHYQTRQNPYR